MFFTSGNAAWNRIALRRALPRLLICVRMIVKSCLRIFGRTSRRRLLKEQIKTYRKYFSAASRRFASALYTCRNCFPSRPAQPASAADAGTQTGGHHQFLQKYRQLSAAKLEIRLLLEDFEAKHKQYQEVMAQAEALCGQMPKCIDFLCAKRGYVTGQRGFLQQGDARSTRKTGKYLTILRKINLQGGKGSNNRWFGADGALLVHAGGKPERNADETGAGQSISC